MIVALALLAVLQAPVPAPNAAAPVPAQAPAPQPWTGALSQGLAELRSALEANDREDTLELAGRLGLAARASDVEPARAARVLHDLGLARAAVDDLSGALSDLRAAAGAAGPGTVRESALYAAGTARLLRAEALRRAVPEVARSLGLPEPPVAEAQGGPDALDVARRAYLDARADLLERLRVDARHADTRANLELVTRRLRELERIEREREQQEQEQQQDPQEQQQDPQQEQQQDPQQDPQDPQDSQQEPEQDPESSEQQQKNEDPEQAEPKPEETPSDPEDAQSQESEQETEPQPQPEQEGEIEERLLSREEVQRLLDQLAEIEEEAQAVRARLRERRRKPVDKDW